MDTTHYYDQQSTQLKQASTPTFIEQIVVAQTVHSFCSSHSLGRALCPLQTCRKIRQDSYKASRQSEHEWGGGGEAELA